MFCFCVVYFECCTVTVCPILITLTLEWRLVPDGARHFTSSLCRWKAKQTYIIEMLRATFDLAHFWCIQLSLSVHSVHPALNVPSHFLFKLQNAVNVYVGRNDKKGSWGALYFEKCHPPEYKALSLYHSVFWGSYLHHAGSYFARYKTLYILLRR